VPPFKIFPCYIYLRLKQPSVYPCLQPAINLLLQHNRTFQEQNMDTIRTATRIHPVMAAAAVSVIIVSLTGAAAITGILPTSHGAPEPQVAAAAPLAQPYGAPMPEAAQAGVPLAAPAPMTANYVQPAPAVAPQPQVIKEVVIKEVVKEKPVHHHYTQRVAHNDAPAYAQQAAPAPAPAQPNYLGIGAGALIGGVLGHQVGGGNGKKLATVAGVIGGGILGNEIANRNK
jgi:uncharacterized protein YcfJ